MKRKTAANRVVTIITPNASSNCVGRAWVIHELLRDEYEVQIIGMSEKRKIWFPLASEEKQILAFDRSRFWRSSIDMMRNIRGSVVVACKPLFTSFGIALMKKATDGTRVILDIDDWEFGAARQRLREFRGLARYFLGSVWRPAANDSLFNIALFDSMVGLADEVMVSGPTLRKKFGGTVVWHARDSKTYDPARYDQAAVRTSCRIPANKKIVMFFGTYRRHKGVDDLIKAMRLLGRADTLLVLIGGRGMIGKEGGEEKNLLVMDMQPFDKVPELMSMADVVVIPQRKNFAAEGQVPAKVFDAMAMAKPIVSTSVSDLPGILEGCGRIVTPGDPSALAAAIGALLDNETKRAELAKRAREKFLGNFSYLAMGTVMKEMVARHIGS